MVLVVKARLQSLPLFIPLITKRITNLLNAIISGCPIITEWIWLLPKQLYLIKTPAFGILEPIIYTAMLIRFLFLQAFWFPIQVQNLNFMRLGFYH